MSFTTKNVITKRKTLCDYFKIEKNKYDGIICSKSNKLSIQDKLEEIKSYLKNRRNTLS